ncbi:MAG: phenylalanine--tRNA ligase subunit beta, partial [Pseudomonadota bacterium]|nr:phenylalanine--tRNA ligase subunit beta [Pseudomonadota bacterium]
PNADRLRVCQVDTVDGRKEIVCGAPNARAGLTTIYAPIGAYVPGLGVTLMEKPVRGVISNGMLCSAKELEVSEESDGILELDGALAVGTPAAEVFGADPVIDFEVTPNRADWLGVAGIARDLAAAGVGRLKDQSVEAVPGVFPCPISIKVDGEACPVFAGRVIRGVKNGPSPEWLQTRLRAIGLRPISALVDVTNLLSYDRCRPLHVYDVKKLRGSVIEARRGTFPQDDFPDVRDRIPLHSDELEALDGKTYFGTPSMCVIADENGQRAIGLGGVMGGMSTGCSDTTTEVFIESAYFDPIVTAQTGRDTGISSDAQYRFARGVDPGFVLPGLELATKLILELCGGEPSEITVAGEVPTPPPAFEFDPAYVHRLSGLAIGREGVMEILTRLGFTLTPHGAHLTVQPPTWRRDVEGQADLVEEVARIEGFDSLPLTPLPAMEPKPGGVLTARQTRVRMARRAMAALGYQEAIGWSFVSQADAKRFGGGDDALVLANPIASELDCMRPSVLPGLIQAARRNAARGFADLALFEIGPVFGGLEPQDQRMMVGAVISDTAPRRWDGVHEDALFSLKADLMSLLDDLGAPVASLQVVQGGTSPWWHPGRSARLQLGPKSVMAEFGQVHPGLLRDMDIDGALYAFELAVDALPEAKKKAAKTRPALDLSPLMPLRRDFAFLVDRDKPAADLVRAARGADKALIADARVFDVYEGKGVPEGKRSIALEVMVQPREKTLTEPEIEALSARVVAAVEKATGVLLRG